MARYTELKKITGAPKVGDEIVWKFGPENGPSAKHQAWVGLKIVSVNNSNFTIGLQYGHSFLINKSYNYYETHLGFRGYWDRYNWQGTWQDGAWDWGSEDWSEFVAGRGEGTGEFEWSGWKNLTVTAGDTVKLYSGVKYKRQNKYYSEVYAQSTMPNAPTCYFYANYPDTDNTNESPLSSNRTWEGLKFTFPQDPTKTNYDFLGWYTERDGGNLVTELTAAVSNQNLYAHWELAGHPVVYDKNNQNAVGTMQDDVKVIGTAYTVKNCLFSLYDFHFIGWSTSASGSVVYHPGDTISASKDEDITLYAVWEQDHHAPTWSSFPAVYRCDSEGNRKDDGTYLYVDGSFIADSAADVSNTTLTVKVLEYGQWETVQGSRIQERALGSYKWMSTNGVFEATAAYKIKLILDDTLMSSELETFLSSAFFYMDINPESKVIAFGAGAGDSAATWDDDGEEEIDQSGTVGTLDIHTNTLFSNDVYFHEGSQLMLGGLEGNSGDVLVSGGTGAAPVWRSPINISVETLYSKPSSWWQGSVLGGKVYWDNGELNEDIIDSNGNPIYDFIIVCWTAGTTDAMTNVRGELIVPVSRIHQWNTYDSSTGDSDIMSGQNAHELVYIYPDASPSWYIDIAFGFLNGHHIYATRRKYSNFAYWNICEIIGIKIEGWSHGSAPLGYTRFAGPLSYTPMANQSVNIDTDGTYIDDDITVAQIPYAEVDNEDGGRTVSIAS